MNIAEMVALLAAELKDDVIGMISQSGNVLTVTFTDGTERIITVA